MIKVIPAIDLLDGKCVRLKQGDYSQSTRYHDDPVEMAKHFEAAGCTHLHLVDLDGAKAKHVVNHKVLESIADATRLSIDFGGGIRSETDVKRAFDAGADKVNIGTLAIKNKELFLGLLETYGPEKIILAADVKEEKVVVNGWQKTTDMEVYTLLKNYQAKGLAYAMCTDITKDGMMKGGAIGLYASLVRRFPELKIIASGGVSNKEEIDELNKLGIWGVIIGKAFYEGKIKLEDLKDKLNLC